MKRLSWLHAWLMLLPALAMLMAFTHIPALTTIWHSLFYPARGSEPEEFAGLDNYRMMLDDDVFWQALSNNLWYALVTVPASMVLALAMALWVNGKIRGRGALRLAYFTPTMLPMIAVANIWLFFYSPEIGLFNKVLGWFGVAGINWLGDTDWALPSLMLMTIWKEAGFFMIFYLAALQALDRDIYDAAALEGASRWYRFRRLTLPLLMPTTLFVLVNAVLNAFKLVDHLFILTKGGPNNASNLLLYYIYENAFSFFDANYAATLTVVLLAMLILLALLQFGVLERRIHYR
ncbi:carbohydrate ABC transporter permease [Marinobacterium mangrovicola]|uniref:Carbohydrate ABC transporter membrane protein 1 (CUT1 family) n=1 Tax=Marinobacterium mangrovicola TaxID=1476959 RepID=A0A4R1G544_9GAMM|nr:sugar ABC transporter permease [Marinobacterium mangrovicola]TCK02608.1 carbohydrate ABC transporter membrane protein 1 (CUT1 family) [Marinobacterium mangrovicola]